MSDSPSARRLVENELIFREANQKVQQELQQLHSTAKTEGYDDLYRAKSGEAETPLHFFCECADEKCRKRIVLTPTKYKQLHTSKTRFVILPGHEVPEVERVIRTEKDYVVVDKFVAPPSKATKKLNQTNLDNTKK